jgi:hypothetical protein
MSKPAADRLNKILDRPWYLPRASREEIVGAALAKLHSDLTAILARSALGEQPEVKE